MAEKSVSIDSGQDKTGYNDYLPPGDGMNSLQR